ncbi:MAG: hypothetical protein JXQ99_19010 [Hyphomicrobiaceae bacterium]
MMSLPPLLQTMNTMRHLKIAVICALTMLFFHNTANALTFRALKTSRGVALSAQGPIVTGDAKRLLNAVPHATLDQNGHRRIFLASPGGQVGEAVRVAKILRQARFITMVREDCVSACAMILYPAGIYSILADTGRLGFHDCYYRRSKRVAPLCTEKIAQLAVRHGMPYGSIKMFARFWGPQEVYWMTNVLAPCYGLERVPGQRVPITISTLCFHVAGVLVRANQLPPLTAVGPSFNCKYADTPVAGLLCSDRELAHLDGLMGALYRYARRLSNGQATLRSQREWIARRDAACPVTSVTLNSGIHLRSAAACLSEQIMIRMDDLLNIVGAPRFDLLSAFKYGPQGWEVK